MAEVEASGEMRQSPDCGLRIADCGLDGVRDQSTCPDSPAATESLSPQDGGDGVSIPKQPKVPLPRSYKGFRIVLAYGRIYGVPAFLDPSEIDLPNRQARHPAVLAAASWDELKAMIDQADLSSGEWRVASGEHESSGEWRVASGEQAPLTTHHSPLTTHHSSLDAEPVEFAGWLPIFRFSGNCGTHPQFTHTAEPPPGYRFTCSAPRPSPKRRPTLWERSIGKITQGVRGVCHRLKSLARPLLAPFRSGPKVGWRARCRVLGAMLHLFWRLWRSGAKLWPICRFLQSRHFQSQLLLAQNRGLVFLTSMPYTYGQNPWVVEIEDPTTLFYPLIQNGHTWDLQITDSPYYPIIKTLLESEQCKGILTHMKSTAAMVATLFDSEVIRRKVHYAPIGVPLPQRWQGHEEDEHIDLLFINSWCQIPENLFVRGGLEILEAFAILRERYPHVRLTMRTELPVLDDHYHRLIEEGWVRVIDRFLPAEEMDALLAGCHIFLLPAARVHIVSLLQAMSYGLAVVTSDGWGIEEYVNHEHNGLVVKGRYGKTSWADMQVGMLRENYEPMYTPDPDVVQGLVEAVSRLLEDRQLRRRLGERARQDVVSKFTRERWNQALKELFDRARGCGEW